MYDCFISYSSSDERFAAAVHKDLSAHNLSVFMARISLNPGDRWAPKTLDALKHSTWVIFLASKAACRSSYVQQEWTSQAFTNTLGWSLEQGEDQWVIDGNRSLSD